MSIRGNSPLFSWGFSLKPDKWLLPLFQNNVVNLGQSAVKEQGPYGWKHQQKREHHTLLTSKEKIVTSQKRTRHTEVAPSMGQVLHNMTSAEPSYSQEVDVEPETVVVEKTTSKKSKKVDYKALSDGEVLDSLEEGIIHQHQLENLLEDTKRAVKIRRMYFAGKVESSSSISDLPYEGYDYDAVFGQCCENVIGIMPIPVGVIGPVHLDGKKFHIPMATTEGCLIASAQRGAKALSYNGIHSVLLDDGMTRGPAVEMPHASDAFKLKQWIEYDRNYRKIEKAFNSTSRYARLLSLKVAIAGRNVFLRFKCRTGDAMGMNMISKGVTEAMALLKTNHPKMKVVSISGNYCIDKKPSALNWIEGRGKSVVVDATIPKKVVRKVLKSNVDGMVELCKTKNLIGSAMAGSIGGQNAHSSNLVSAVFIACGQDPAQNVESSNCMTLMEKTKDGDLYMSCTMPSIEVGTIGGGTQLKPQAACLNMLGVKGANLENPGKNAQTLARLVASAVMCGELSLMAALESNDLVTAHMKFNRKPKKDKS